MMSYYSEASTRHKVFISYYHANQADVNKFIKDFSNVFIPKALGVNYTDDIINSKNTDYVMQKIRERYLTDSTVTIVLLGSCTHSRRYVDWEIKSSLTQGTQIPNGLIGIILPSEGTSAFLPSRFAANWQDNNTDCYARFYRYPQTSEELRAWIADAHDARTSRAHLISNRHDKMGYNIRCNVCGVTH